MGHSIRAFQPTPNPNAIKCLLSGRVANAPRSYFKPEDAAEDPLGSRLFSISGISNLLIHPEWITVGKRPDADWKAIKAALERVLHDVP